MCCFITIWSCHDLWPESSLVYVRITKLYARSNLRDCEEWCTWCVQKSIWYTVASQHIPHILIGYSVYECLWSQLHAMKLAGNLKSGIDATFIRLPWCFIVASVTHCTLWSARLWRCPRDAAKCWRWIPPDQWEWIHCASVAELQMMFAWNVDIIFMYLFIFIYIYLFVFIYLYIYIHTYSPYRHFYNLTWYHMQ